MKTSTLGRQAGKTSRVHEYMTASDCDDEALNRAMRVHMDAFNKVVDGLWQDAMMPMMDRLRKIEDENKIDCKQ